MGSRGPKRGALNAGRPKLELSDTQWADIENSIKNHAPQTVICHKYHTTRDSLERLVREKYGLTLTEYWDKYQDEGNLSLLEAGFKMATSGKYPLMTMYYLANWCGYVNTNQITRPGKGDSTANTALAERMVKALEKLNTTQPKVLTQINNIMPENQQHPHITVEPVPIEHKSQPDNVIDVTQTINNIDDKQDTPVIQECIKSTVQPLPPSTPKESQ